MLFDRGLKRFNRTKDRWWDDLDDGSIEKFTKEARTLLPKDRNPAKDARRKIGYFKKNEERMPYPQFKEDGPFAGFGVIQAGYKNIIAQRLKQSGMQWTVRRANAIIAMRRTTVSDRTEDYCEQRVA